MPNKSLEYLQYLNSEEGIEDLEKLCKKVSKEMKTDLDACRLFYNSSRFRTLIIKLKTYLNQTHEILTPDDYGKKNVIKGITNDAFRHLFKVIFTIETVNIYNTEFEFRNDNIEYEGLIFTQVYGQGTHYELALAENSRFQKK